MAKFKPAPVKPGISFDLLEKIDVRVGTIVAVEDLPRAKTLVKLVVDFGDHRRNILAGVKQKARDIKDDCVS